MSTHINIHDAVHIAVEVETYKNIPNPFATVTVEILTDDGRTTPIQIFTRDPRYLNDPLALLRNAVEDAHRQTLAG